MALVASLAVAWLGLRLLVEHWNPGRPAKAAFQFLYGTCLLCLLLMYAIILVGLSNWGRVPTWRLITVYVQQWRDLLMVLDVPVVLVPIALVLAFVALFIVVRMMHARLRWPSSVAVVARFRMSVILAGAAMVPLAIMAVEAYSGFHAHAGEPIAMTFNSGAGAGAGQGNRSEGGKLLDQREAEAAARYQPGVIEEPRNVVLIVGDALRAGNLSVLHYGRPTTPYLDSLAAAGRLALAQPIQSVCAESYCGLLSIARSKFVHEFSVESLTLQQVLDRHGYRIGLILGGDHTNFYGLSEALGPADYFWDGSMGSTYVNDDRGVIEHAANLADWDGTPTFLQFHLMSTHGLGRRHEEFVRFLPASNYYKQWQGGDTESRRAEATNFYDNGVLQFDSVVMELLQTLEQRGYLHDAVVVVTGDHGEMLGEKELYSHSRMLYRPVLEIPLMILRFGYEGQAIELHQFASQVDIAPTIVQELGLPVPDSWSGQRLQGVVARDFIFIQQSMEIGLFDLRDTENVWKFWVDTESDEYFAFDAIRDPEENLNRAYDLPANLRSEWMLQLLPAGASIHMPESIVSAIPVPSVDEEL